MAPPCPLFFPTYLALGLILLLQHGGHLILKEAELLIYLLQKGLPLRRVQKAALYQNLRNTRDRLTGWAGSGALYLYSFAHLPSGSSDFSLNRHPKSNFTSRSTSSVLFNTLNPGTLHSCSGAQVTIHLNLGSQCPSVYSPILWGSYPPPLPLSQPHVWLQNAICKLLLLCLAKSCFNPCPPIPFSSWTYFPHKLFWTLSLLKVQNPYLKSLQMKILSFLLPLADNSHSSVGRKEVSH